MSTGARVESIDALKAFRATLYKFAETAIVALGDAESEMNRTLMWLETEQHTYWQGQIRKRTELLSRAQEALRQKTLFKDSSGRQSTGIDEQKVVAQCKRRLESAHQKLANVKLYTRRLQKEIENYRGTAQRFATTVQSDVPRYASKLDRLAGLLDAYTQITPDDVSRAAAAAFAGEMTRAAASAAGYGDASAGAPAPPPPAEGTAPPATPDVAAAGPAIDVRDLRARLPHDHLRLAAAPAFMPTAGWKVRPLNAADRAALAAAAPAPEAPDPSSRIILRRGAHEAATIYLHRLVAKADGDSGWYVASAEPEGGATPGPAVGGDGDHPPLDAMRVSDFLAVRPDLAEALSLPGGHVIVLSPAAVLAVFDPQDRAVWTPPADDAPTTRPRIDPGDLPANQWAV